MLYKKTSITQGNWAKTSEIESGITAKIVSETLPQPSQFLNKDGSPKNQDVAKILFKGYPEALNVSLNRTTINGLIDCYGEDSNEWKDKELTVETEKMRVAGKAVVALYLIPQGYKRTDDNNGFAIITKDDSKDIPIIDENEVDVKDIPF